MTKTLFDITLLGPIVVAVFSLSGFSSPATALVTFQAGQAAVAADVNANFLELSERIDDLKAESGPQVAVDCTTAANALQTAVAEAAPGSELVVTGNCVGPVLVERDGIALLAASAGTDQIFSDGINDPVLKITGRRVTVKGLKIAIVGGTDESAGLSVAEGGSATIDNLYAGGTGDQLIANRLGTLTLQNTTNIDNLSASEGGQVRLEGGNSGFQIIANLRASVDIRVEAGGSTFEDVVVRDASTLRVKRGADPITIKGKLEVFWSANARFLSRINVNYNDGYSPGVEVFQNSSLELWNATINAITDITCSPGIRACGIDFNDPNTQTSNDGLILVDVASSLVMQPCYGMTNDNSSAAAVEVNSSCSVFIVESTLNSCGNDSGTHALNLADGGQISLEASTANDRAFIRIAGLMGVENSTFNADLHARGNAVILLESNSSINAMGATDGACPSSYDEGAA